MPPTKPTKKAVPVKKTAKAATFAASTNTFLASNTGTNSFIGINSYTIRFNPAGGVGYYDLYLTDGPPILLQQIDAAAIAAVAALLVNPKTKFDPIRQELVLSK